MITLGSPKISRSAFVDRSATVLGDVTIGDGVYIAPNASIRADEPGSKIVIGPECNVQDNVVIHALRDSTVSVGAGSSLAHGCIVHGPCTIGEGCFIGFGTVVFRSTLMDGCVLLHRAVVTETVLPPSRLVANGAIIDGGPAAQSLPEVPEDMIGFVSSVRQINMELAHMYGQAARGDLRG